MGILGVGFLGGCTQKNPPGFLGTYPGVWTLPCSHCTCSAKCVYCVVPISWWRHDCASWAAVAGRAALCIAVNWRRVSLLLLLLRLTAQQMLGAIHSLRTDHRHVWDWVSRTHCLTAGQFTTSCIKLPATLTTDSLGTGRHRVAQNRVKHLIIIQRHVFKLRIQFGCALCS